MDIDALSVIREYAREKKKKQIIDELERERIEKERRLDRIVSRQKLESYCIKCGSDRYLEWLISYVENGGTPTHFYKYPSSQWKWYLAKKNIKPVALYGSNSMNIVVPIGVDIEDGNYGHSDIYTMDGPRVIGGVVPVFADFC